jgi:hypothetical protein
MPFQPCRHVDNSSRASGTVCTAQTGAFSPAAPPHGQCGPLAPLQTALIERQEHPGRRSLRHSLGIPQAEPQEPQSRLCPRPLPPLSSHGASEEQGEEERDAGAGEEGQGVLPASGAPAKRRLQKATGQRQGGPQGGASGQPQRSAGAAHPPPAARHSRTQVSFLAGSGSGVCARVAFRRRGSACSSALLHRHLLPGPPT